MKWVLEAKSHREVRLLLILPNLYFWSPGANFVVAVQLLSCDQLFATPWTAACQASLSFTISRSCSNSCPLSQWCHATISSSVVSFSSCLQSFPAARTQFIIWNNDCAVKQSILEPTQQVISLRLSGLDLFGKLVRKKKKKCCWRISDGVMGHHQNRKINLEKQCQ